MLLLFWDGASPVAEPEVVYPPVVTRFTAAAVSDRAQRIAAVASDRQSRISAATSDRTLRTSRR